MKTKYLDIEIERLNLLERNEDLTDWGKKMLSELKEIKKALNIPNVSQQRELLKTFVDFYNERQLNSDNICYDEIDLFLDSI